MKNTTGRRSFLKKISVGGVGATMLPAGLLEQEVNAESLQTHKLHTSKSKKSGRDYNGIYKDEFLKRVAFPIGGLGAGMFCMEGVGAISHMSVRNKPDVFNEPGKFGAIAVRGIPARATR